MSNQTQTQLKSVGPSVLNSVDEFQACISRLNYAGTELKTARVEIKAIQEANPVFARAKSLRAQVRDCRDVLGLTK